MSDQTNLDKLTDRAATVTKDAVYFGVGLVVVTVQKAQEQLEELRKQLESQLSTGREHWTSASERFTPQCKTMDEQYARFEQRISELVDEYGAKLPDPVEKIVDATFESAKNTRAQMRELFFGESKAKATAA